MFCFSLWGGRVELVDIQGLVVVAAVPVGSFKLVTPQQELVLIMPLRAFSPFLLVFSLSWRPLTAAVMPDFTRGRDSSSSYWNITSLSKEYEQAFVTAKQVIYIINYVYYNIKGRTQCCTSTGYIQTHHVVQMEIQPSSICCHPQIDPIKAVG